MLNLKRKPKATLFPGKIRNGRPYEVILAVLDVFQELGKKEISLTELQDTVSEYQKNYGSLGYIYSSRFLYSLDLLSDLEDLVFHGYVHDYQYKYNGFLPNRYLALTSIGKGRGRVIVNLLPTDVSEQLSQSVYRAEQNYKTRWRLWAR